MDYSQLSDFEINGMVASLTQRVGDHTQARNKTFIHEHADVGDFKSLCLGWKEFDPCNNWSDAGPIIVGNKITIHAPMHYDDPLEWLAFDVHDSGTDSMDVNPLRAAMIVFLKMHGAKHA